MSVLIPFPGFNPISLSVSYNADVLTHIEFVLSSIKTSHTSYKKYSFEQQITNEFEQYFLLPDFKFSLLCQLLQGTEFQQRVWQALLEIPAGEVMTYGQLALKLNSSPRAVGNACRNNLFPVIIPCHRVVSASGVGGYAGDTLALQKTKIDFLAIKKWLLAHEKSDF